MAFCALSLSLSITTVRTRIQSDGTACTTAPTPWREFWPECSVTSLSFAWRRGARVSNVRLVSVQVVRARLYFSGGGT